MSFRTIARGLRFPEGPIAMPDGSVVLVEIGRGTLTRVKANGTVEVIAELGGGPNGAAIGPDGKCYVCNNGGFKWIERNGRLYPERATRRLPRRQHSARRSEYRKVRNAVRRRATVASLCGPNDIVFDRSGGFWFTDHGKTRPRERDRTGVFYARADGSHIIEAIFPLEGPNGIGLSRDED